ncbi:MAG: Trans-L-3-hydroxyproline dehydratase [Claussenomyces sp. TS43310]|nr:MAG: Trans-L-3-hydroxyproline dehydratase [Claussenomyces sp. TS43310]
MDISAHLSQSHPRRISCVEMHTTGEPVRIVYAGFPETHGTLLEQRTEASTTTCRVSIRTSDTLSHRLSVQTFPNRAALRFDPETRTVKVLLHAPCGLVEVTVPAAEGGRKVDPSRAVSFDSVPSYATALDLAIRVPASHRWPELGEPRSVAVDVAYGGTYYALVAASELGFPNGLSTRSGRIDIDAMSHATALLKETMNADAELQARVAHPEAGLSFLYSITVVDDGVGLPSPGTQGVETGLCFFGDHHQVDRSPTGSCVSARMAVALDKGKIKAEEAWTYHSVVSNAFGGQGEFVGRIAKTLDMDGKKVAVVRTAGTGWYTGSSTFVAEEGDELGKAGFSINHVLEAKGEHNFVK